MIWKGRADDSIDLQRFRGYRSFGDMLVMKWLDLNICHYSADDLGSWSNDVHEEYARVNRPIFVAVRATAPGRQIREISVGVVRVYIERENWSYR
jgi:hypothetical protein